MGMGATDVEGRVLASLGAAAAVTPEFAPAADVPNAGVLAALPALLSCGLLGQSEKHFELPPGYYGLPSIFLLLACLALARVKSLEDLRYCAPGEWGKVLGLDRVPEVRTLRAKLRLLTSTGQPEQWSAAAGWDFQSAPILLCWEGRERGLCRSCSCRSSRRGSRTLPTSWASSVATGR